MPSKPTATLLQTGTCFQSSEMRSATSGAASSATHTDGSTGFCGGGNSGSSGTGGLDEGGGVSPRWHGKVKRGQHGNAHQALCCLCRSNAPGQAPAQRMATHMHMPLACGCTCSSSSAASSKSSSGRRREEAERGARGTLWRCGGRAEQRSQGWLALVSTAGRVRCGCSGSSIMRGGCDRRAAAGKQRVTPQAVERATRAAHSRRATHPQVQRVLRQQHV